MELFYFKLFLPAAIKGIPANILEQITQQGFTFDKENGSGLGLYHAKEVIEEHGGKIDFDTIPDKGTRVIITLPLIDPPVWFLDYIRLKPKSKIIILDDDQSIHYLWKGRYESMNIEENQLELIHFTKACDMTTWIQQRQDLKDCLFLVDYELLNQGTDGLDLIEAHNIAKQSILVTSRSEEKQIIEKCNKLKVKLLPKALAGYVPFEVIKDSSSRKQIVIIDDDKIFTQSLKEELEEQNKEVTVFHSSTELEQNLTNLNKDAKFLVDLNIQEKKDGIKICQTLYKKGFRDIHILTADSLFQATEPFIKSTINKKDFDKILK
ncbi:MAG: ATP-binding protein [bacterium]